MGTGAEDITVRFFASLKDIFKQKEAVVTTDRASIVLEALDRVCTTPERRRGVFADTGALQPDVLVLVNGRNIVFLEDLATPLHAGDVVSVFPPVKGG
jgi:molybdopterin synthase sulfur carrier subunit